MLISSISNVVKDDLNYIDMGIYQNNYANLCFEYYFSSNGSVVNLNVLITIV